MWTDEQIEIAFLPVGCAEYASDAADVAMEIARRMRDEYESALAEATGNPATSGPATGQWEPVESLRYDGLNIKKYKRTLTVAGNTLELEKPLDRPVTIELPSDLRLCRLVQTPGAGEGEP